MIYHVQSSKRAITCLAALFSLIGLTILNISDSQAGSVITTSQTVPTRTPAPELSESYLPLIIKPQEPTPTPAATSTPLATAVPTNTPLPTATSTPSAPPASFNDCRRDPNSAPNFPVQIITVNKSGKPETVTLKNVSGNTVDLTGWIMCSVTGNQRHEGVSGLLVAGEQKTFAYTGGGNIWNNSSDDDGSLYNASGQLISFWDD